MNRKQRRALAQQGIDHKTIKAVEQDAMRRAVSQASEWAIAAALMVLRDKFGFGSTRAQKFIAEYSETFEALNEGRISFDDVVGVIEDELKITFTTK